MGRGATEFDPLSIERSGLDSYGPAVPSYLLKGLTYIQVGSTWAGIYRDGLLLGQGNADVTPSELLAMTDLGALVITPDMEWMYERCEELEYFAIIPQYLGDVVIPDSNGLTIREDPSSSAKYLTAPAVVFEDHPGGFFALYKEGAKMVQGDPLNEFDLPDLLTYLNISFNARATTFSSGLFELPEQLLHLQSPLELR